jgi:exodeoxyribonuclease V alpha subunit
MKEHLSGVIERITFHNPETGFTVLRVLARGPKGVVAVVGTIVNPVAGEFLEADGEWVHNRDHGLQFKADEMRTVAPQTEQGITKYLGSGLIKGIGPHFAKRIVEVFGERTLKVIDESPAYLAEVKGIGPRRIQRIRESWQEQKAVRDIMVFLQSHGVGTARAVRIYKTYGEQAIDLVRENPYRLATDIWGIGFESADQLAVRLGIPRDSPKRAAAALRYVLQQLSNSEGHCGYPESGVLERTASLTEIDRDILTSALEELRQSGEVVREPFELEKGEKEDADLLPGHTAEQGAAEEKVRVPFFAEEPWLYLRPLFFAELGVARSILDLRQGDHPLPKIDTEAALNWVEKKINLTLAVSQRDAIHKATTSKVMVLTGGPGTGKTTIVRGILEIFSAKKLRCALCAPTGRAAKRLSETTGREARTIHRLLEFDPAFGGFKRDRDHRLDTDLLIVDETSMVDIVLMNQLLRAVPPWACVVLVGDVDQLPSVGPGAVLADIINSRAVPVVRLTEIFRQAGQSWIIQAAHQVNHGEMPEPGPADRASDFYIVEASTPEAIIDRIVTMVKERIPARFGLDALRDVQVLTPMNRSELGTLNLNKHLQEVLNQNHGHEVARYGWTFRTGDKVIQTENNYKREVFNGDIGRITAIDIVDQEVTVDFDSREVVYDFGELDELALAYALSIHRAQGSEYPAVIIPLHGQHYIMLQRNLLYTAITRGKKLVVLVGTRRALAQAVQRQDTRQRCTALRWRLE